MGVDHNLQRFVETLEVRDQDFNPATGGQLADLADGLSENARAAQVVVVAIHAGHDRMLEAESCDRFGNPARFVPLNRTGLAFGDGAKSAAPGTNISQQHESRGALIPALSDVGTLRRFAHRVQAQPAGQFLQIVKVFAHRSFGSEPVRLGLPDREVRRRSAPVGS